MSRVVIALFVSLAIFSACTFAYRPAPLNCSRENEEYQCGSACQTTCSTLGQHCAIINIKCNDACYCKNGYARIAGDDSPCISVSECPNNTE